MYEPTRVAARGTRRTQPGGGSAGEAVAAAQQMSAAATDHALVHLKIDPACIWRRGTAGRLGWPQWGASGPSDAKVASE